MSRNIYFSLAVFSLLPLAGGIANARTSFIHRAENPFDNNSDGLPDLGMAPESRAGEKHFAEMVKAFGEASMTDNGLDTGEQAKQFAFGQVRDTVSEQVNQQLESTALSRETPALDCRWITKAALPEVGEAGLSHGRTINDI